MTDKRVVRKVKKTLMNMSATESERFRNTILGLMAEYNITMLEALIWEFEALFNTTGEKIFKKYGEKGMRTRFDKFMEAYGVTDEDEINFYGGVFFGSSPDFQLGIAA